MSLSTLYFNSVFLERVMANKLLEKFLEGMSGIKVAKTSVDGWAECHLVREIITFGSGIVREMDKHILLGTLYY